MTTSIVAITFSCDDPHEMAEFWAKVLGERIAATAGSEAAAILGAVPLYFRKKHSEAAPSVNSIHLDLSTEHFDTEIARLRELGAIEVRRNLWHSTESVTFLDIEKNAFDLVAE